MKKITLFQAGLLQALGVIAYVALISLFFNILEGLSKTPHLFLVQMIMLSLLVFSAAITGVLVFGYPTFLIAKNRLKDGLLVFGYTLLFLFVAVVGLVLIALV
ncbi:hypothetical protein ACFLZY_02010 [Patescibacteria group bacterium]